MRTMLMILPYAGLILTTLSAIWGLTHELTIKTENNERRLTKAGRYSIAFVLLGLLISLNTGVLKTVIENQDKAEAQAAEDRQKQEAALEKLDEKARLQALREEERKTQDQIDRKDQDEQKRDFALARQQIEGFSKAEGLARLRMFAEVQRAAESAEQAQKIIGDLDRSLHPLFPIKIRARVRAELRGDSYAAYRERLVKAAPVDEESPWPELAERTSLFPDEAREKAAYNLLLAPPRLRLFLVRHRTEQPASFEPDLSILMESTSGDPPVLPGQNTRPRPKIEKEYSFSRDGVVFIHFPTETISSPGYSNGQIVSDLDLLGARMTIEISPWFSLAFLSFELSGNREIQFNNLKLEQAQARSDSSLFYSFTFPKTKEEFSKLFVP